MSLTEKERLQYLSAMGIPAWELKSSAAPLPAVDAEAPVKKETIPVTPAPVARDCAQMHDLAAEVAVCVKCPLHKTRTQTVFGTGDLNAKWVFIGEAPGQEEDRQGIPFVGRAGQLLNSIIFAMGLRREQVYIANVLKCRPPNNRDPQPEEVEQCEPYLLQQLDFIKPSIIIALGRHATHNLLKTKTPLSRLRGQKLLYHETPLVVTYHPAYLLRSPREKAKVWTDLRLAMEIVGG